jgi:glucose/arabinose dehydrogenase
MRANRSINHTAVSFLAEKLESRRLLATVPAGFIDQPWGGTFSAGTQMEFAPDGRLFVMSQTGQVRIITPEGQLLPTLALGNTGNVLTVDSFFERGLLGIAFDPSFNAAAPGTDYVYLYYTVPASAGGPNNRISRFEVVGDQIIRSTEATILNLNPLSAGNHNGGGLHFGPDGKLYLGVGENAVGSNAQNLNNLLGKILRVNPDPANPIPTDNPTSFGGLVGSPTGNNRAIWAVGLRNPFTTVWNGNRYIINDVGNVTWEEINNGVAGSNYGWSGGSTDGFQSPLPPGFTNPVYAYQHGGGVQFGNTIVGGVLMNSTINPFPAPYNGKYFFGDYINDWIGYIDFNSPPAVNSHTNFATGATDVVHMTIGPDGAIYWLGGGATGNGVHRILPTPAAPLVNTTNFVFDGITLPNPPHLLKFAFNTNVRPSLSPADLTITNTTTNTTVPTANIAMSYDYATNTATFTFPGYTNGILPDGRYTATLNGAGVTNALNQALPSNSVVNFHVLAGDADHDGDVDLMDFNVLSSNFGQSPRIFSQGDFTYNGSVDLLDFNVLAQNFGVTVGPSVFSAAKIGSSSTGKTSHAIDAVRDDLLA